MLTANSRITGPCVYLFYIFIISGQLGFSTLERQRKYNYQTYFPYNLLARLPHLQGHPVGPIVSTYSWSGFQKIRDLGLLPS